MNVNELLEKATELYDEEVTKIENKIREELLIPFCKKHHMKFDAGMGSWSLDNEIINIYGSHKEYWEVPKETLHKAKDDDEFDALCEKARAFREDSETVSLVEALESPTLRGVSIGCNIENYDPYKAALAEKAKEIHTAKGTTLKSRCPRCREYGFIYPCTNCGYEGEQRFRKKSRTQRN